MITRYDLLITVLSWEDRFIEGFRELIINNKFDKVFLLNHSEMQEEKKENFDLFKRECNANQINFEILDLPVNPIDKWNLTKDVFLNNKKLTNSNVLLDISTMRRETIWVILSFLRFNRNTIKYVYSTPISYNKEWLSREPDTPRLLLKHSGISEFGKVTALLILTGFDADRTRQLVNYYEPELTIIGTQIGRQYENDERNSAEYHTKEIKGLTKINTFQLNSYSVEEGYEAITETLSRLFGKYNIVVSSQGPKLSALSIYKAYIEHPQISLSYVPCRLYNVHYSEGLKEQIFGTIDF